MKSLILYEVVRWGGQGEKDLIFLVSAFNPSGAAELVLHHLRDRGYWDYPDVIYEISKDPRVGHPSIVMGPCEQLAMEFPWKKWKYDSKKGAYIEEKTAV